LENLFMTLGNPKITLKTWKKKWKKKQNFLSLNLSKAKNT
jgi:hypothetical protein